MEALASSPHWIPEDDVLLKNAVEGGASLESLAKGAVQFSRRFTIQELQDRWFSLLYDPVVSEEASAHMVALELYTSTCQSRLNRSCGSGKRRAESVKKCYYAVRKRICNEPFDMMDFSVPSDFNNSSFGDGNGPSSADCTIVNPVSNSLEIQGPESYNRHHSLCEVITCTAQPTNNVAAPSCFDFQRHDHGLRHDGKIILDNIFNPYEENIFIPEDHTEVPAFDGSKEFSFDNFYEAEGLENVGNACPEFGGPPFDSFGCSPLHQLPIWSASADISMADLPIQLTEEDQQEGDKLIFPEAGYVNEAEALRCGANLITNSKEPLPFDAMRPLTPSTVEYFAELSDTLFDLTNENEMIFIDTDGKDAIPKSYFDGLGSLLLDSPIEAGFLNADPGEAEKGHFLNIGDSCPRGSENKVPSPCDQDSIPEAKVLYGVSTFKNIGPEYRNGVICCTLNTEDPDIPSNDDVFLPYRFPSPSKSLGSHKRLHKPNYLPLLPVRDFSNARKTTVEPPVANMSNPTDSCGPSRVMGKSRSPDAGVNLPVGDHGIKFELPKSNIQNAAIRNPRKSECSSQIRAGNESAKQLTAGFVKEDATEIDRGKNVDHKSSSACLNKHPLHHDLSASLQDRGNNHSNDFDIGTEVPGKVSNIVDLGSRKNLVPSPVDTSQLSDHEKLWSDNDLGVPHFSDIEAIILDMDLSPDEFDLDTLPEVQRYQHEECKRTIIRLEQQADACMQRTIAAHGAFALLYGRYSRHYIKKPEVLLGRGTEDMQVDINLGRERNGGKISRRQASIKMEMDGSFHLKNLGKCSVYVNGIEALPGQTLNLTSGCLIEMRGLAFVFETNISQVKHYVDSIMKENMVLDQKPVAGN